MNFWYIFFRVLPRDPVAALAALWWQVRGKRLRARNRLRVAGARLPFAYKLWMRNIERPAAHIEAARVAETWTSRPQFDVIIDARGAAELSTLRSVLSVEHQSYGNCRLKLIGGEVAGQQNYVSWHEALNDRCGDFIVPLRAGDQLSPWALFRFAEASKSEPGAAVIYGDEDQIDELGRRTRPWFKPRWNEELFLAKDYISRACAIKASAAFETADEGVKLEPETATLELLLHAIERGPVVHVPQIITHLGQRRSTASRARIEMVARHVTRKGATTSTGPYGSVKVTWPLPCDLPLVSIIVPTRDKVDLLEACVGTVLSRSSYAPFELLIVDNGSVEPRTIDYLNRMSLDPRIRIVSYPHPYNYSAVNNFAARHAGGSYLCLLNNDTEVIEPDWLTELMRYAVRPDIGAAGAKLLYSDGTIQHAGVVIGIGDAAGHAHRNLAAGDEGYFGQAHVPQFVSAVTGACLVVDMRKFLAVGGLDEQSLPIAFNDVDLCLKLERAGWRNVYVPHALLIHHESKSRERDNRPNQIGRYNRELRVFRERWRSDSYDDPLLNPNLDRSSETFVIRF